MIDTKYIKYEIDKLLDFDSKYLFEVGDGLIYGGAIRDIIAKEPVNDIDIVCLPITCKFIQSVLLSNGFKEHIYYSKSSAAMYLNERIINEPLTYINDIGTVVQLIRPVDTNLRVFVEDVDFSNCALSYDGTIIREYFNNAIFHCQAKVFTSNGNSKMGNRYYNRLIKFESRGWKYMEINEIDIYIRNFKINKL